MGVIERVCFKITGQVPGDYRDKDYKILKAKLKVICEEYDLELDIESEE